MRVLVVEDDPDLADLLRDGLVEEGYAVDLSRDGEDGLWRATTVDYDAAVLDIMLPEVDGVEILRRMPFLVYNRRTYPDEWLKRNHVAARRVREDAVSGVADSAGDRSRVKYCRRSFAINST